MKNVNSEQRSRIYKIQFWAYTCQTRLFSSPLSSKILSLPRAVGIYTDGTVKVIDYFYFLKGDYMYTPYR